VKKIICTLLICFVSLLPACTSNKKKSVLKSPIVKSVLSVAVLNFDNNSIDQSNTLTPFIQGFASMFSTDLANSGHFRVIERRKIKAIMEQMALSQSGVLSQDTAIQVGKMAGAKHILFGSFIAMGDQVRIDVRVVDVETSLLVMADSVMGMKKHILNLEKQLVHKLVRQSARMEAEKNSQ